MRQSKKLTTVCPTCGKQFEYYPSWPRKFCSRACSGKQNVANIRSFRPTGYDTACEQCGKTFHVMPRMTRGRFCSRTCFGKWQSVHIRGDAHPTKGRKYGRLPHWGPLTTKQCEVCGKDFVIKPSHAARRRFCSKRCMGIAQGAQMAGKANMNWQGGYEPYYGPSWRKARRAVLARDKVCQRCGMTPEENGRELDVHHIKPFRTFGVARHEEANDLSNLTALCHDCHLIVEWETNR